MKTIVVTLPMTRWAISIYERQSEIKKKMMQKKWLSVLSVEQFLKEEFW